MLSANERREKTEGFFPQKRNINSSSELKFIAELGRQLLFTVHPKKVAARVAEAVQLEARAKICAVVVELENVGFVSCNCDAECSDQDTQFLNRKAFKKWIEILPPQISVGTANEKKFLLKKKSHGFEYISPLHINGEVKGAVIVGFSAREDCQETTQRLIDAATQMAAMSLNLSARYEAAMKQTIDTAKEEHRKFTETVVDALPVSLYVIDRDYRIVAWNRHREIGTQGLSRDSVIGRDIFEVLNKQPHSKLRQEFERAFRTGKIERIEQRTTDDTGATKHWLVSKIPIRDETSGEVTHVITVGEDVTMRVEAIHAVGRAEKLAAIGRLAAGIVHEINNPLATISACAEALESRVGEGVFGDSEDTDDLCEYLGLIRNETFRCKSITNGLLDFSRVRTGNRIPLDINLTLNSAARLLAHQKRGAGVNIRIEAAENLPLVSADEGQIQQAIIALATNAIDAMPDGGEVVFRTTNDHGRVKLEIEDTGSGIAPEDVSKIFEPFYTTKEVGKGTGLGLAVCYGIITEHGGRLAVRSTLGAGTTFTIFLPAYKKSGV